MNAGFLQTFVAPTYGSNMPLWTISAEFWFYVVFGLAAATYLARSIVGRTLKLVLIEDILLFLG